MTPDRIDLYLVYGWRVGSAVIRKAVLADPSPDRLHIVVSADGKESILGKILASWHASQPGNIVPADAPPSPRETREAARKMGLAEVADRMEDPKLWLIADRGVFPALEKP